MSVILLVTHSEEFLFPALLAYVLYGVIKWLLIGFLGRSSTPDEIYWEREAELHQTLGERTAFGPASVHEDLDLIDETKCRPTERASAGVALDSRAPREPRFA